MGQGSRAGRCWRRREKLRISTRTSSLLVSQKSASNSRSSSGVRRSEEKIVVGATGVGSSVTGWRFRRRVFMAIFLFLHLEACQLSSQQRLAVVPLPNDDNKLPP